MASSVVSIVGAFALFHFVLGPKLVSGVVAGLDANGTLKAASGGHSDGEGGHGDATAGHESGGGGAHGEPTAADDPSKKDESKGAISIVGEGESIVVNPANSNGTRYLLVDIYLVRASEKDKEFKAEVERNSKELQALTMDELSSLEIKNLSDPSVKTLVKDRLRKQYETVLEPFAPGKNRIGKLIISRWIMQ